MEASFSQIQSHIKEVGRWVGSAGVGTKCKAALQSLMQSNHKANGPKLTLATYDSWHNIVISGTTTHLGAPNRHCGAEPNS